MSNGVGESLEEKSAETLRDIFWKMYQENVTEGRHHETQRATVTNLVITIAAAALALVTFDKAITTVDLPLTIFLVLLGMFGAAFSSKYYERFQLHMERARAYRNAIDSLLPNFNTLSEPVWNLKEIADAEHEESILKVAKGKKKKTNWQRWMTFIHKRRLYQLWLTFHLLIALIGLILSIVARFFPIKAAQQLIQPDAQ
jgi:hypothetical protein